MLSQLNSGKAKMKKSLTLVERKQQKEEKQLRLAEERSLEKGNSPAPIKLKISLKVRHKFKRIRDFTQ